MTKSRKIILISNGFYPEISPRSFRATELAKEFVRQGHKVVVYSKFRDFDYSEFLKGNPMDFRMWSPDRFPRIPQWKGRLGSLFSRGIARLLLLLFEYPGIEDMFKVKRLLKKESGYDLMISFSVPYPVHWGVAWSRSKTHPIANKWVADCGDPYMGAETDNFIKLFYFKYFEKWFSRKASIITIPKIEMIENYYKEFHHKIIAIPQGFSFKNKIKTAPKNKVPTFAFAGSFIPKIRDPRPLLNYMTSLNEDFRFIIYSNNFSLVKKFKEKLNDKLILKEYIPREELLIELSEMDFLINIGYDPVHQVPSKLIDYAIADRPVFNISGSFSELQFIEFLNGNYENAMILPDITSYRIENVSASFLDLIYESGS